MSLHKQQSSPGICPQVISTPIRRAGIVISVMLGEEDYLWGQACQDVATGTSSSCSHRIHEVHRCNDGHQLSFPSGVCN